MNKLPAVDFSDLEDLGALDADAPAYHADGRPANEAASLLRHGDFLTASAKWAGAQVEHTCERCRGTGRKAFGVCYRCNGTGKQKRAPVDYSQAAVQKRVQKRDAKQDSLNAQITAWHAAHPDASKWLTSHTGSFATSLLNSLCKYGSLTDGQVAAVRRILAEDADKAQARAELAAKAPATTETGLDISSLPAGYYAVPEGGTRLKLRVQRPKANSKWAGYIFVNDGAVYGQGTKYGSQRPGGRYQGKAQEALTAILANPRAAVAEYGRITGTCGVCGRALEDAESVARGIGPICAENF